MMTLKILSLLIPLFAAGEVQSEPPTAPVSGEDRYGGNACVECHREEQGRLGEMVNLEWAKSVHFEQDVGCEQCHGGDATLRREQFQTAEEFKKASHATFKPEFLFLRSRGEAGVEAAGEEGASYACRACHSWTTEGRLPNPHTGEETLTCLFVRYGGVAMSRERGIAYICATCHPETTEKQLGSAHGSRGAPSCLFCHSDGTHNILPATVDIIDPRPREELGRCSLCHTAETMKAVQYVRETLEKADEQIKMADEQFAQLDRLGYRSLALGEMYEHVDEVRAALRQVQHGCNVLEISELAKSIEHSAKRVAYDYDLVLALRDARHLQTKIALGVAGLLLFLVSMLLVYRRYYGTRSWDRVVRDPVRRTLTPPCNAACPAGNDVLGFITATIDEDYDKALEVLLRTTPFPSVCGRLCAAPCMDACNRRVFDEAINIRDLERYVGDRGRWRGPIRATRDEQVAVIGAGPAGLSATYQLVRLGYKVTLFERDDAIGGAMRSSIPRYRLPSDVLDREIARILEYDVELRTACHIEQSDLLNLSLAYDAVFVATGQQHVRGLDLGQSTRGTVRQGVEFLERARNGAEDIKGKRVVVLGGGNVAIDVARTALRLSGAEVRIYCLETRNEMPAHDDEIEEALAEGVEINNGWGLDAIDAKEGSLQHVGLKRCVSVFDAAGSFAPLFNEDDQISIDTDVVIIALGQSADLSILPEGSVAVVPGGGGPHAVGKVHEGRPLLGTARDGALHGAGPIFAGGDFATNEGTVSAAIGSGRRAAWHIHRAITGQDLLGEIPPPIATPDNVRMHLFTRAPRQRGGILPINARRAGFAEVNLGYSDDTESRPAVAEAKRCFSCGVCNQCDRCVSHCPEGIVTREDDTYRVEYDYCRGCGTCANECPRGVIQMVDL